MIGITGHKGVLGTIIQRKLEERFIKYSNFTGDIRNEEEMCTWIIENNISKIIFLASKVAVKDVNENRIEAYDVNIGGIIKTLAAIKKSERDIYFFYSSSSHVYKSKDSSINERDELNPPNTYGLTKKISEEILLDYNTYNENFKICIGRIFSFYHDSQKPPYLYPTIKNRIKEEDLSKPFFLHGAQSERDFLNAEEVCEIIIKLIDLEATGVYNIGSGKGTKIIDFVKKIVPINTKIIYDENEVSNYLIADISKLKNLFHE